MKHNWEYKKLGDICSIVGRIGFRGYTREDLVEKGNGAISLSPSNIIDGKLNFDDKVSYLSWEKYFESPEIMLAEGDVVFTKTASIGKCALVKHLPVETTLNPQLVVLKNIQCDSSYLTYMLQDKRFQEAVLSKKGGTSIPTISQAFLGSLPVPVPPIETQKQIVAELDKINETIEDCRELLRNLDALAQSLFYDFFGDPITNPKGWETKSIQELAITTAGGTPSKSHPEYYMDGNIRWLRSGEVCKMNIIDTELRITELGLNNCSAKIVPVNSVVVAMYGATASQVGIIRTEMALNQAICAILPNMHTNPIYLYFCLSSLKDSLLKVAHGAAQPNISQAIIKSTYIPVPPLALQEQFATRIEQIEAQKEAVESTIAELQTLLDSRMDYWFN